MKKRIYKSVCLLLITAIIVSVGSVFALYAVNMINVGEKNVCDKAQYLSRYIDNDKTGISSAELLKGLSDTDGGARITLIDKDGTVLFDNMTDVSKMENHGSRREVVEAIERGIGMDRRISHTLEKSVYYSAVRLSDGRILRVSETHMSLAGMAVSVLVELLIIIAVMCTAAIWMASRLSRNIMEPINEIDINHIGDTSAYKELQPFLERIKKDNEERDKTERIRREFSANVSHELRTPLTTISGYAQMINNGMARPEDVRMFGEKIEKESERLILLVNDIINLSRLDETDSIASPERINLHDIARQVISDLTKAAEEKNVVMYLNGYDAEIFANRTMLYEMIYNVTDNAVKYNRDGGTVTITTSPGSRGAQIVVSDTGIGIAKEEQSRIFERFYRVDKSHSRKIGGTGLGLSIVKHAAIAHNAEIDLESEPGKGTAIRIIFPDKNMPQSGRTEDYNV